MTASLACSRLSDSGEDAKEKGTRKVGGVVKRKKEGRESLLNHLFYDPLPPTFGTFEIIRFRLSNCWNVNELESFSNSSRDYFVRRLSHMRVRARLLAVRLFSYSQTGSSVPRKKPLMNLLFKSWIRCYFQTDLCILACVMSREFTREAVMKFLPAPFSWIWCKCLLRNLIHSKIFNLTKYREVLVKYSMLITHKADTHEGFCSRSVLQEVEWGRNTHIDFLTLLFLVGMIDDLPPD